MTLVLVSDLFSLTPAPVPAGGMESGCGFDGWRGVGNFLSKGSFDPVRREGGRVAPGLGDGRSITFVETQCLSKVKSDLAFLS